MVILKLEKFFPSEQFLVDNISKELLLFLQDNIPCFSSDDSYDFKLIFHELLYNAIIHGNQNDTQKNVFVFIEILEQHLVYISVTDEGNGFDYMDLIASFNHDSDFSSEHGRGIRIVKGLTDEISFNMSGNGVKIYKKVANHG